MLHFRSSEVGALRVINFVLVNYVKVPRELGVPVNKYEVIVYSPVSWYGSDDILNSRESLQGYLPTHI